jgi:transposase
MAYEEITTLLGGWPGFELIAVARTERTATAAPQVELSLRAVPGHSKHCGKCGEPVEEIHDVTLRRVRDLPILEAETWLTFPLARVACPRCGPTREAVSWLDRYQRMTARFAAYIARLASVLPIKHVAELVGVHWHTVKAIDKAALTRRLGPPTFAGVRWIAIDDFALHRGHRFATTVIDAETRRVLWVSRERDQAALTAFFAALGPVGCAQIEAVVMDMWPAYRLAVTAHCPQAQIVYDCFHVLGTYKRDVLDRVRVDEANRLQRAVSRERPGARERAQAKRRVIKGSRWLLLANRGNLRPRDRVRLKELLEANRALMVAYVLKDDLKQLWRFRYPAAARRFWRHWCRRARASGMPTLISFARRLDTWIAYVINHCRYPLHTSLLEGINNKIKVLKRMAYGYRDDAYFFLKIRAAFPGIPR